MIAPWQVWFADLGATGVTQPLLIVSSAFHLRLSSGRLATVAPVSDESRDLEYRVPLLNLSADEPRRCWVMTEQMRTIDTAFLVGDKPAWELEDEEIKAVQDVLRHMLDLA